MMRFTYLHYTLLWALFGVSLALSAQPQTIEGRISDHDSKENIPFAHITLAYDGKYAAAASNIEGHYKLPIPPQAQAGDSVYVSCVGYQKYRTTLLLLQQNPHVSLKPRAAMLRELVVKAKEDPGYEIIRRAVANRNQNDPERLEHFRFQSYNKASIDALRTDKVQSELDKTGFAKAHFFMMESATEVLYRRPGRWKETVVANQLTGIRNPAFGLLSNSFQPFSVYTPQLLILGFEFLNPISPGSDQKYVFELADSTFVEGVKTYIVTFQPRRKVLGNLLEGAVSISADTYAVVNFRGQNSGEFALITFDIRQDYTAIDGIWFPKGSRTSYLLPDDQTPMVISSTTYYSDIDLTYKPSGKEFGVAQVSLADTANRIGKDQWGSIRPFELDTFETNTFLVWDTVPKALSNAINWGMEQSASLARGRLGIGKADLLLGHILRFNQYEGVRLGIGLGTNEKFAKWIQLDGYFAYGFRDKQNKYGGSLTFPIKPSRGLEIGMGYARDVDEPGRGFTEPDRSFLQAGNQLRNLFTRRMNPVERYMGFASTRPARGVLIKAFAQREERSFRMQEYINDANLYSAPVVNTEAGLHVRLVPNEALMQVGNALVPIEIKYPRLDFSVRKALPGTLDGALDYTRADAVLTWQFRPGRFGQVQLYGQAGQLWGRNIGYPWLQYLPGILGENEFGLFAPGHLQTAGLYEFLSDQYALGSVLYNLGPVFGLERKFTKPELKLTYTAAAGSLRSSNQAEVPFEFRTMDRAYLEGGIIIDNLFRYKSNFYYNGFGLGAFYRHGHYAFDAFGDNVYFILSFAIGI